MFFEKTANAKVDEPEDQEDIPPAVDAVVHVSISGNGLEAYVDIEPPSNGGASPTFELLNAALVGYGITQNVDVERLKALAVDPIYDRNIVVANGVVPVDGKNGTVAFLFDAGKKDIKPRESEDGKVDYYNLGIVENVKQGQVLCTITPPTEGTPGISVKGVALPQKKGQPAPSYLGENTELNEDGTAILSKINGQIEFDGRKINVRETFFVRGDIDFSTGNIKVESNLVVSGAVLPGFKIAAGRNIDVSGSVENSTIQAGGNIRLNSGITGSELHCDGDLICRFIENCDVFVKGDIKAEYILNSNIKCGKNIKTVGKVAKIIGGNCVAGQNIEAGNVGTVANVKTRLELGTDYASIKRQQELQTLLVDLGKKIESVKQLITLLKQLEASGRMTPDKKEILDKVESSYVANIQLQEAAKKELEEIALSIKNKSFGKIVCTGTIFPGTTVVIGPASLTITEPWSYTALYLEEGSICKGIAR
jgi:uncharacterized protein (DUF342 family)